MGGEVFCLAHLEALEIILCCALDGYSRRPHANDFATIAYIGIYSLRPRRLQRWQQWSEHRNDFRHQLDAYGNCIRDSAIAARNRSGDVHCTGRQRKRPARIADHDNRGPGACAAPRICVEDLWLETFAWSE